LRRRIRGKLKAECRAQIELHLKLIGYLNHIDGHVNFHVRKQNQFIDKLFDLAA
jgi:hypothetical protein